MQIRRAEEKDINSLLDLLGQVLDVHVKIRPDIFKPNSTKFTKEELNVLIHDDIKPIFVATENNKVLGCLFTEIKKLNTNHMIHSKSLYIEDLCVDEKERGNHIGTSLLKFAIDEAKRQGCKEITLNSWAGNDFAEKFYKKYGFKLRSSTLEFLI